MLNRLLIFLMLSIGIVEDSSKGISPDLLRVEESSTRSFSSTPLLKDEVRLASLTEQQKKEMFLKAREDLFPAPPSTTAMPQSASSEAEKKKERKAGSVKEASITREKKVNNTNGSAKKPKKDGGSKSKDRDGGSQNQGNLKSKNPENSGSKNKSDLESKSDSNDKSDSKGKKGSKNRKALQNRSESQKKNESKTPQTFGDQAQSQIRIVKSGYQEDEGLMPTPPQTGKRGAFKRSRYLTPAVRRAIDRAPVKRARWKYIIIHNSGTRQGNARIFDIYHRRVRHMQNGLAYHFVIGNGRSSGNGQIEIGHRWQRQINGGHVASDYLNNIAIGICLVGDYNRDTPTPQQLTALEELISYLQRRVGRYRGRLAIVLGHREINPKPTDCPGRRFPLRWLHQKFPNR